MATVTQVAKSRTNQATAVIGAVLSVLPMFGIVIPAEASVGIMALVGFVMRFITKEPLEAK